MVVEMEPVSQSEPCAVGSSILQYLDHLQDIDYLAHIINTVSGERLCQIIDELLRSDDNQTVRFTGVFIRDLVLLGTQHPDCNKFVKDYLEPSTVITLQCLLSAPNHFARLEAAYTLGKICSYSSIKHLDQAFTKFRDTDPILLPRLVFEMSWLGANNFWALIDSMSNSPIYPTRWAIIAVFESCCSEDVRAQDELFQGKLKYLEKLRGDSNHLIQAESEYEHRLLTFRSEMHNLSKADRKKQQKTLDQQYKPAFCFDQISMMFSNHLYTKGITEYSISELEMFISNMASGEHS
jgi:hypothetical protein